MNGGDAFGAYNLQKSTQFIFFDQLEHDGQNVKTVVGPPNAMIGKKVRLPKGYISNLSPMVKKIPNPNVEQLSKNSDIDSQKLYNSNSTKEMGINTNAQMNIT